MKSLKIISKIKRDLPVQKEDYKILMLIIVIRLKRKIERRKKRIWKIIIFFENLNLTRNDDKYIL
jgi:hypothetical protein